MPTIDPPEWARSKDQAADPVADSAAATLASVQESARYDASHLLQEFWTHYDIPRKGGDGVMRVGWGHAIELSPQHREVSDLQLSKRVDLIAQRLAARIFVLLNSQPSAAAKVCYLYAIADVLGVEAIESRGDLWARAGMGDWAGVCVLLTAVTWRAVESDVEDRRLAAATLIFQLRDAT